MDAVRFDAVARVLSSLTDRRATGRAIAGGALGVLGLVPSNDADAKKKKKKCKKPKVKCGKKCCAAGSFCDEGECVACAEGEVFCAGGPSVPSGCLNGVCCLAGCSGSTCCPPLQGCAGPAGGPFSRVCLGQSCGSGCCPVGHVCSAGTCGQCTVGTDPCSVDPALQCGCGFCATSVSNNTACVTENEFDCAECDEDSDCTAVLGKPSLCITADCAGCAQGQKVCIAICP